MNAISIVVLIFSLLGAADYLFGSKLGLGREFVRAFSIFSSMLITMPGMIVLAPAIGVWLTPLFEGFYRLFGIDPSIIPASLFAADMGGMPLAISVCHTEALGNFNGFVVATTMGCVISYIIPFSISIVPSRQHRDLFLGLLCGIVTIPLGCLTAGLLCKIDILTLLLNLLPLIILSLTVGTALILVPDFCIAAFRIFGFFIKALTITGLGCAIFTFLSKIEISPHFDTLENALSICLNICITLSGALPFMYVVSRLLRKPLGWAGKRMGINETSAICPLSSVVSGTATIGMIEKMDSKGTVLNVAFLVAGGCSFGSHLAYTMAFNADYILPVVVGKLTAGLCGLILAMLIYKKSPTEAA